MKLLGLLTVALALGFIAVGLATTARNPPVAPCTRPRPGSEIVRDAERLTKMADLDRRMRLQSGITPDGYPDDNG